MNGAWWWLWGKQRLAGKQIGCTASWNVLVVIIILYSENNYTDDDDDDDEEDLLERAHSGNLAVS